MNEMPRVDAILHDEEYRSYLRKTKSRARPSVL